MKIFKNEFPHKKTLKLLTKTIFYTFLLLTIITIANYRFISNHAVHAQVTNHYLYTFPDGNMYVYDIDNNFNLVKQVSLPTTTGVRGATVDPASGMLYLSYGGNGGGHGNGSLLKYNLLTDSVVWTVNYNHGVD